METRSRDSSPYGRSSRVVFAFCQKSRERTQVQPPKGYLPVRSTSSLRCSHSASTNAQTSSRNRPNWAFWPFSLLSHIASRFWGHSCIASYPVTGFFSDCGRFLIEKTCDINKPLHRFDSPSLRQKKKCVGRIALLLTNSPSCSQFCCCREGNQLGEWPLGRLLLSGT